MNYNISLSPVSDDDQPLKDEQGNDVNFRKLFIRICCADFDLEGQPIKGQEKLERYDIYAKLKRAKDSVNLSTEEASLLKKGALAFPTIVAGQVRDFLDQKDPS